MSSYLENRRTFVVLHLLLLLIPTILLRSVILPIAVAIPVVVALAPLGYMLIPKANERRKSVCLFSAKLTAPVGALLAYWVYFSRLIAEVTGSMG